MTSVASILPSVGFGDYTVLPGKSFGQMQCAAKVQKIFLSIILSLLTLFSSALIPVSLSLGLLATAISGYFAMKSILTTIGIFYRSPPMNELFPKEVLAPLPTLGEVSPQPHRGFATKDGVESQEWKLNLIRAARHNIFLSGCYCGGKAFEEALELIRQKMRGTELKTSILASNVFITAENKKRMAEMEKEFGSRFCCIVTSEVFPYTSPITGRFALTTNHTKALIIDYGAAFMVGGSGMTNDWAQQTGEKEPLQFEKHGLIFDYVFKMRAYRDMDFVFQSTEFNGIGTRFYVEMSKLFERFRNSNEKPQLPRHIDIHLPMPRPVDQMKLAIYANGPDNGDTSFLKEIVSQIKKAEKSIVIGHMYFHPPKEMLNALIEATKRGVKITLITNRRSSHCPGSHYTYSDLSRYYSKLVPDIELYEFTVPYTTYHKKVVLIDGKTSLVGSTNIGMKSLLAVDYEINLKVESEDFATSIAQSLEADKQLCKRNPHPQASLKTRAFSSIQSLFTPFL